MCADGPMPRHSDPRNYSGRMQAELGCVLHCRHHSLTNTWQVPFLLTVASKPVWTLLTCETCEHLHLCTVQLTSTGASTSSSMLRARHTNDEEAAPYLTTASEVCQIWYSRGNVAPMHLADPEASLRCYSALPLAESQSHSPAQHSTAQHLSEKDPTGCSNNGMSTICGTISTCNKVAILPNGG